MRLATGVVVAVRFFRFVPWDDVPFSSPLERFEPGVYSSSLSLMMVMVVRAKNVWTDAEENLCRSHASPFLVNS